MGDGIITTEHSQWYTQKSMRGTILFLDFPEGSFDELISRLQDDQYNVIVRTTFDDVLDAIETEKPELLIASGDFPEVTGPQLAEQVYSKLTIPIFLVLSTAGEETQTLLRRHPAVIGVYYRPINVSKMLIRIERFFEPPSHKDS
jgi:DNA-binding response OmpR family regulator